MKSTEYEEVYIIQRGLQNTRRPTEYKKVYNVLEVLENAGRSTLYRIQGGLHSTEYREVYTLQNTCGSTDYIQFHRINTRRSTEYMQVYRSTDYIQFHRIHEGLHNQRSTDYVERCTEYM